MLKKPITYVRRVTNLSDARYCAGMGVDMLGYVIDPAHADYVSPKIYQEISGWIAGPRRVVEILTLTPDLRDQLIHYSPELIHIHFTLIKPDLLPDLPLVVECDFTECNDALRKVNQLGLRTEYLLVTGLKGQSFKTDFHPLLIDIGNQRASLLLQYSADGLSMSGTHEQAPGLKDYDHLAQVFEEIDHMD
jgi:phosphoribosylanthranilate isomerase